MSYKFHEFEKLHYRSPPLLLQNVWDAASAKIAELSGMQAIATSSASLSWSKGFADNGSLPLDSLLMTVSQIAKVTDLPITIDIEDGYSDDPFAVAELVSELMQLGVVGINIEDGQKAPTLLCDKIAAVRQLKHGDNLFINARTDIFLNGVKPDEKAIDIVVERLNQYQMVGANGGFIPGLSSPDHVSLLKQQVSLPLNLMILDENMDLMSLFKAGIQRFSSGPFPFLSAYSLLAEQTRHWLEMTGQPAAKRALDYAELNKMFI